MEDSVLRCLVPIKLNGVCTQQIFPAVREADQFLIVLEWGSDGFSDGVTPRQCVAVPLSEIEFIADPMAGYELECALGIDFDAAKVSDVDSVTSRFFYDPET
jgi:hypothetical protein